MRLINSLKEAFLHIKNSPLLFLLSLGLQLAFVISVSAVFVYYAIEVGESAQAISSAISGANISKLDISAAASLPDISGTAKVLEDSIFSLFIYSFVLYIIVNGLNWSIAGAVIGDKKRFLNYHLMLGALFLVFALPSMFLIDLVSKPLLALQTATLFICCFCIIVFSAAYFMYISFALAKDYDMHGILQLIRQAFVLGAKEWKALAPAYIIALAAYAAAFSLIYLALEANFLLLVGSVLLFVLTVSFMRIYCLTVVRESEKQLKRGA